jgi:hypothetical protein
VIILPVWFFGDAILGVITWAKEHWYLAIPIALTFGGGIVYYFNKATKKMEKRMMDEN